MFLFVHTVLYCLILIWDWILLFLVNTVTGFVNTVIGLKDFTVNVSPAVC